MENHFAPLDAAFHALADPTRRAVIAKLITGPATVKDLAAPFEMGLPSFLKHVKVLEDARLIRSDKTGRVRTCSIMASTLAESEQWLRDQRAVLESQVNRLAAYVEAPQQQDSAK